MSRWAALAISLLLAGCTGFGGACPDGLAPAHKAELFFGRNSQGTETVSDAAWAAFVAHEIVPRFPNGFTVTDAAGHWRSADGKAGGERSKVLTILLAAADRDGKLAAIRRAYRTQFHQESVLLIETSVCAAF